MELERVHAGNITDITIKHAFNAPALGPVPTVETQIDETIDKLDKYIARNKKNYTRKRNGRILRKEFKKIILPENLPDHYELSIILSSWVKNPKIFAFKSAKQDFRKNIVKKAKKELRAANICNYGEREMKRGRAACNKYGVMYDADIDHIIEQKTGGNYPVNNEGNFTLIPKSIHTLKNRVRDIQNFLITHGQKEFFSVALVPKLLPNTSGFISPAQSNDIHKIKPAKLNKTTCVYQITHALDVASYYINLPKIKFNKLETGLLASQKIIKSALNNIKAGKVSIDKKELKRALHDKDKTLLCSQLKAINTNSAEALRNDIENIPNNATKGNKGQHYRKCKKKGRKRIRQQPMKFAC